MSKPLRILMLEDNPIDVELVEFELHEAGMAFTAKLATSEETFVHGLQTFNPDVILSDYDLPRYSGALALAQAKASCPDVPFILVTGAVSEDRAIEILTSGAKDYVMKSRLNRLVPAVRRVLVEAEEHRRRQEAETELRSARKRLEEQVAERTAELQKKNERLAILSWTAGRLLASDNPQAVVEELCLKVMEALDCQAFFNFLVDEGMGRLRLNAYAGIPAEAAREIEWLDYGIAVCGCAARDGCRIVAENILQTPDVRTELVKSFGIRAYACHPLLDQGRVMGTLSFGTRSRDTISEDDLTMMKTVTDQVAVALHRIRNENALREARSELELVVQERTAELTRTVTRLEDEKLRFNQVLDALPVYVILLTPDYHVPFENRFFRERFGDANGRRCFDFLFGRSEPCDVCETYTVLKRMAPHEWEWTGPDGRHYYIFDFPFTDVDGATLILEMGIDVTETKRTEAELATYRHRLEELVEQRTAELEEANRELESFSYSASHDLRAPLRAIAGYARLILDKQGEKFDGEGKRLFHQITDQIGVMVRLIDDLLAFSRLGKQAPEMTAVDIRQLMEETWRELRAADPGRSMILKVNGVPPAWGDPGLIKQVLVNLTSNAIKFTKSRDTAIIEVGGYGNGGETVYYVKDNGIGFDMKYADKLFGVFQRLHNMREYEGSGIGLALVQRLVHKHSGRVWAEGEVNRGATFYFTLPGKG